MQRGRLRPQDPHHVGVWPVVEDLLEHVDVGAVNGLRREEVVPEKGDAVLLAEIFWYCFVECYGVKQ